VGASWAPAGCVRPGASQRRWRGAAVRRLGSEPAHQGGQEPLPGANRFLDPAPRAGRSAAEARGLHHPVDLGPRRPDRSGRGWTVGVDARTPVGHLGAAPRAGSCGGCGDRSPLAASEPRPQQGPPAPLDDRRRASGLPDFGGASTTAPGVGTIYRLTQRLAQRAAAIRGDQGLSDRSSGWAVSAAQSLNCLLRGMTHHRPATSLGSGACGRGGSTPPSRTERVPPPSTARADQTTRSAGRAAGSLARSRSHGTRSPWEGCRPRQARG